MRGALGVVLPSLFLQPLTCTERIAFQASQDGLIQNREGTDQGLAALAGRPEFEAVAKKVANERGIHMKDIFICVGHLYHEVSKHAPGSELIITVRAKDYVPGEVVMLVTSYLKPQEKWPHALSLRLEEAKGEGGGGGSR